LKNLKKGRQDIDMKKTQVLFGKKLSMVRKARGLSQEKLADMAGVSRNLLGRVEHGEHNLTLNRIVDFAHALKVSPVELFELIP
jgi:transcriptional regulator with XRE-family HTH domain